MKVDKSLSKTFYFILFFHPFLLCFLLFTLLAFLTLFSAEESLANNVHELDDACIDNSLRGSLNYDTETHTQYKKKNKLNKQIHNKNFFLSFFYSKKLKIQ